MKEIYQTVLDCLLFDKNCNKISIGDWAVILGIPFTILSSLYKLSIWAIKYNFERKLEIDLHPYYTKEEIKIATKYYINTKGQNRPPSRENEPIESFAFSFQENLIEKFLNKNFNKKSEDNRFYIVLADSGMGKTTFMINLYLKYVKQIFRRKYKIKLMPLAYPDLMNDIDEITDKGNTIILLDAFDEDNLAIENYVSRLETITAKVRKFREIIITCRTQFLPNEAAEYIRVGPKFGVKAGYVTYQKVYISPFNDNDIHKYLNKKYPFYEFWNYRKKRKAFAIVKQSPNLMVRPMLLNYIDDLVESNSNFDNTAEIYKELINKWIVRESSRTIDASKYEKELFNFSKEISMFIYNNRSDNPTLTISKDDIKSFAQTHKINLEMWQMTGRSLLNRDAEGRYKFAHKSILEYFVAFNNYSNVNFILNDGGDIDMLTLFIHEIVELNIKYMDGYFFLFSFDISSILSDNKIINKNLEKVKLFKKLNAESNYLENENSIEKDKIHFKYILKLQKLLEIGLESAKSENYLTIKAMDLPKDKITPIKKAYIKFDSIINRKNSLHENLYEIQLKDAYNIKFYDYNALTITVHTNNEYEQLSSFLFYNKLEFLFIDLVAVKNIDNLRFFKSVIYLAVKIEVVSNSLVFSELEKLEFLYFNCNYFHIKSFVINGTSLPNLKCLILDVQHLNIFEIGELKIILKNCLVIIRVKEKNKISVYYL